MFDVLFDELSRLLLATAYGLKSSAGMFQKRLDFFFFI